MAPTTKWVAGASCADLAKALPLARDVCAADDAALRRYVESIRASGDTGLRIVRANVRHVCAEEEQRLERAITAVSRG